MRFAAFTTTHRCRQGPARIENEQIAWAQVIVDLIKTGVLSFSSGAINHHQTYLIASNPASLRQLFCAQFRRQHKRYWSGHRNDWRTKSTKLATGHLPIET